MQLKREALVEFVRREFLAEQESGFRRLKQVPDTDVIRFCDEFPLWSAERQSHFVELAAQSSAYGLANEVLPPEIHEKWQQMTSWKTNKGVRYLGVLNLAQLAKEPDGLDGWLKLSGATGLALTPPEELLADLRSLKPATTASLKKLVLREFASRFDATARDLGDGFVEYHGKYEDEPVAVRIRYLSKLGGAQLEYRVRLVPLDPTGIGYRWAYESLLRVGHGMWNYLTTENAGRSIALLGDLVESVVKVPGQLQASCQH